MTTITKHGRKRIKKRLGAKKANIEKEAQKAFEHGITHHQSVGEFKSYLSHVYRQYSRGNNLRVYNRRLWLFQSKALITVFDLPSKFHKIEDILKDKLKNE